MTFVLPTGQTVACDDQDFGRVSALRWHLGGKGYVKHSYRENGKVKTLYLHQFILGTDAKVDHKDTDKLNNRRLNLRFADSSQNAGNSRAISKPKTSVFKGVYWQKHRSKWSAQIGRPRQFIGLFTSENEAALAYDAAAKARWGEFARLNFCS